MIDGKKIFAAGYDAGRATGAVVGYYDMAWAEYASREGLSKGEAREQPDIVARLMGMAFEHATAARKREGALNLTQFATEIGKAAGLLDAAELVRKHEASTAGASVEEIARFVQNWNGDTADGHTGMIAGEIRARFGAAKDREQR